MNSSRNLVEIILEINSKFIGILFEILIKYY